METLSNPFQVDPSASPSKLGVASKVNLHGVMWRSPGTNLTWKRPPVEPLRLAAHGTARQLTPTLRGRDARRIRAHHQEPLIMAEALSTPVRRKSREAPKPGTGAREKVLCSRSVRGSP